MQGFVLRRVFCDVLCIFLESIFITALSITTRIMWSWKPRFKRVMFYAQKSVP